MKDRLTYFFSNCVLSTLNDKKRVEKYHLPFQIHAEGGVNTGNRLHRRCHCIDRVYRVQFPVLYCYTLSRTMELAIQSGDPCSTECHYHPHLLQLLLGSYH